MRRRDRATRSDEGAHPGAPPPEEEAGQGDPSERPASPPKRMRKHTPLVDEEGTPLISPAATVRTTHDHYEGKYGGGKDSAKAALHNAVSETWATARDGHGGSPLTFTREDILTETQALAKRKRSAPGPDAVSYEILGLIGKKTAEVTATALTEWCADMGTQDLPQIWAQCILSLIPKAGKGKHMEPASHRSCVGYPEHGCGPHSAQDASRPFEGFCERLRISSRRHCQGGCHAHTSPYREDARRGEHIHVVNIDISDAFGRIQYDNTRTALESKIGCRRALPLFRLLVGTSCSICVVEECSRTPYTSGKGVDKAQYKS